MVCAISYIRTILPHCSNSDQQRSYFHRHCTVWHESFVDWQYLLRKLIIAKYWFFLHLPNVQSASESHTEILYCVWKVTFECETSPVKQIFLQIMDKNCKKIRAKWYFNTQIHTKIKSIITTILSPFSDIRHAVLVSSNYSVLLISVANRNLGAAKHDTHAW